MYVEMSKEAKTENEKCVRYDQPPAPILPPGRVRRVPPSVTGISHAIAMRTGNVTFSRRRRATTTTDPLASSTHEPTSPHTQLRTGRTNDKAAAICASKRTKGYIQRKRRLSNVEYVFAVGSSLSLVARHRSPGPIAPAPSPPPASRALTNPIGTVAKSHQAPRAPKASTFARQRSTCEKVENAVNKSIEKGGTKLKGKGFCGHKRSWLGLRRW